MQHLSSADTTHQSTLLLRSTYLPICLSQQYAIDLHFFVLFQLFVVRNSRKTKKSPQIWYSVPQFYQALRFIKRDFKCVHQALKLVLRGCAVWFIQIIIEITFFLRTFAFIRVCTLQIFVSKAFLYSSALRQYNMS